MEYRLHQWQTLWCRDKAEAGQIMTMLINLRTQARQRARHWAAITVDDVCQAAATFKADTGKGLDQLSPTAFQWLPDEALHDFGAPHGHMEIHRSPSMAAPLHHGCPLGEASRRRAPHMFGEHDGTPHDQVA